MKKTITSVSLILIVFISSSAFIMKYTSGIAGYTNSPGETSCSTQGCHSGGSSASSGIDIQASPAFDNGEYIPGTFYTISIKASASGYTKYGFGCEILDDVNHNAGSMQTPGAGVHFLNFGPNKKNAVHTQAKGGNDTATFSFMWIAPDSGNGDVNFYVAANAVNGNGSSSGDFPISPISLALTEGVDTTVATGIREVKPGLASHIIIFPNPSNGFTTLSYNLNQSGSVVAEVIDISGKTVKTVLNEDQNNGTHSQLLNLQGIPSGVYFIKTSVNNQKVAQKLITIN